MGTAEKGDQKFTNKPIRRCLEVVQEICLSISLLRDKYINICFEFSYSRNAGICYRTIQ